MHMVATPPVFFEVKPPLLWHRRMRPGAVAARVYVGIILLVVFLSLLRAQIIFALESKFLLSELLTLTPGVAARVVIHSATTIFSSKFKL